ncbi:hypothetical protein Acy02nite_02870 [Actinoplanes cyaneus]|uniref:Uncharacterized protein n=1 Tax=Actinoplanes cyaneus TaxID=52696 RepID=A0A919M8W9_9ACTN|nr:hypothetical protein Acy02nite_02870 [Actinoplanes cyaneus]
MGSFTFVVEEWAALHPVVGTLVVAASAGRRPRSVVQALYRILRLARTRWRVWPTGDVAVPVLTVGLTGQAPAAVLGQSHQESGPGSAVPGQDDGAVVTYDVLCTGHGASFAFVAEERVA